MAGLSEPSKKHGEGKKRRVRTRSVDEIQSATLGPNAFALCMTENGAKTPERAGQRPMIGMVRYPAPLADWLPVRSGPPIAMHAAEKRTTGSRYARAQISRMV